MISMILLFIKLKFEMNLKAQAHTYYSLQNKASEAKDLGMILLIFHIFHSFTNKIALIDNIK